jgi:FkbM family methyltransferase
LFEPVQAHFPSIERNYARVRHILHPNAVSNVDGEAFLNSFSITAGTGSTHSQVSDRAADSASVPTLVSSVRIQKRKLDTITLGFNEKPYLLKVDIDGPDLQVLQGADRTLQSCAAVVIEAPLMQIPERSKYLTDRGFRLVDIVGPVLLPRVNVAGGFGVSIRRHTGFERGPAPAPIREPTRPSTVVHGRVRRAMKW